MYTYIYCIDAIRKFLKYDEIVQCTVYIYYSVGFREPVLKYWRLINKSVVKPTLQYFL